ncbi:MAG TPA: SDR family oxidoreductase [Firmicutes bacterium]|nr:SDR family oxidoreductase [Bacillota bacterium]
MRLKDKVALVTGGAEGIGAAIAKVFAREGAAVAVVDVNVATGNRTVQAINDAGGKAIFLRADVSKSHEVKAMVEGVIAEFGRVDILVNNAGVTLNATVADTEEDDWERVIGVDLTGVYLCSKYIVPHMVEHGGGNIINIGSIASFVGLNNNAAYNAAKGGVMMLTRNMAVDYAPMKIRVNALCPGMVMTPMLEKFIAIQPDPKAYVAKVEASTPLGRIGTPEEVAEAALFLATDECPYITGAALMVDGGYTAR